MIFYLKNWYFSWSPLIFFVYLHPKIKGYIFMLQTIKNQTNMKLKMIPCSNCGQPMPELRLLRAGFSYCVTCSENGLGAGRKQGVPVMMG